MLALTVPLLLDETAVHVCAPRKLSQRPPTQYGVDAPHALPHPPQWLGSVRSSTHRPPQSVRLEAHTVAPDSTLASSTVGLASTEGGASRVSASRPASDANVGEPS